MAFPINIWCPSNFIFSVVENFIKKYQSIFQKSRLFTPCCAFRKSFDYQRTWYLLNKARGSSTTALLTLYNQPLGDACPSLVLFVISIFLPVSILSNDCAILYSNLLFHGIPIRIFLLCCHFCFSLALALPFDAFFILFSLKKSFPSRGFHREKLKNQSYYKLLQHLFFLRFAAVFSFFPHPLC